jgi:DNA primase
MSNLPFDNAVRDILSRVSMAALVGEFVKLTKAGRSMRGLCPFHPDKSPSFHINEEKKLYYCFACREGGNAITFLKKITGMSSIEVLRSLAEKTGVRLPETEVALRDRSHTESKIKTLYHINRIALAHFRRDLKLPAGTACMNYLRQRGITDETIEKYKIGFAPDSWDSLHKEILRNNISVKHVEEVGLVIRKREGGEGYYDRFRNRLIFPIFNLAGEITGFGGRTLPGDDDAAKYINSSDSMIFKKGDNLFGLNLARDSIRKNREAVVVEGYMDQIGLFQAGIENTVAPLGTALTISQVMLLKQFAERVFLVFDGDDAGLKATVRAIKILIESAVDGYVVRLPAGEDPDSFVKKNQADALNRMLLKAKPMASFLFEYLKQVHGVTAPGISRIVEELKEYLSHESDTLRYRTYVRECARILDIDNRILEQYLRKQANPEMNISIPAEIPAAELKILEVMVRDPSFIGRLNEKEDFTLADFSSGEIREIVRKLIEREFSSSEEVLSFIMEEISQSEVRNKLIEKSFVPDSDDTSLCRIFNDALNFLQIKKLEKEIENKRKEFREEISENTDYNNSIQFQIVMLRKEIENIKSSRQP